MELPSPEELSAVSPYALLALAARWAKRSAAVFLQQQDFDEAWTSLVRQPIELIEKLAESGGTISAPEQAQIREYASNRVDWPVARRHPSFELDKPMMQACWRAESTAMAAANCAFDLLWHGDRDVSESYCAQIQQVGTFATRVAAEIRSAAENAAHATLINSTSPRLIQRAHDVFNASQLVEENLKSAMRTDFDNLSAYIQNGNRAATQLVVKEVFPCNIRFYDLDAFKELVDVTPFFSEELIAKLRATPQSLYELAPRQFEELIARLFDTFGFDVELTQQSRDGGYDICAVRHRPTYDKFLIECKRYSKTNKVDVKVVRELAGVVTLHGATKGIIATTSTLTGPAQDIVTNNAWLLEASDFNGVLTWLEEYDQLRMLNTFIGEPFVVDDSGLLLPKSLSARQ